MEQITSFIGVGLGIFGVSLLSRSILASGLAAAGFRRAKEENFNDNSLDREINLRTTDNYFLYKISPLAIGAIFLLGAGYETIQGHGDVAIALLATAIPHLIEPRIRRLGRTRLN